jgi:hypothetical protein
MWLIEQLGADVFKEYSKLSARFRSGLNFQHSDKDPTVTENAYLKDQVTTSGDDQLGRFNRACI